MNAPKIIHISPIKKNQYGEYVVRPWIAHETNIALRVRYPAADYFTTDKADAVETAKQMMEAK